MTDLVALVIAAAVMFSAALVIADAQRRHRELIRLLNDLATMLGEMFDKKE